MPYIEIHTTQGAQVLPLRGHKMTIGRHDSNTVTITDDHLISRYHCEIEQTLEGYVLRDLDSRNGTTIEGLRIVKVVLQPGAEFRVGNTLVRFLKDKPTPKPAPVPAEPAPVAPSGDDEFTLPDPDEPATDDGFSLDLDGGDEYTADRDHDPSITGPGIGIGSIDALATVGEDVPFGLSNVSLINARGQVVHAGEGDAQSGTAATLRILRLIVLGCIRSAASDVHLEPKRNGSLLRLRIDGAMVGVTQLDPETAKRLASLIKVLSDIDMTKKAIVQEGHFSSKVPGRRVDYRVSFTPSMFGQKLVLRVLDPQNAPQQLKDLDLPEHMYQKIRATARQDTGMLLVCGPTGSGKTTTLYATLRQIDASIRNVITIEDPVEYEVQGVTQIPVDEDAGQTFSTLLRSCLRQDPDVIVLGEIRDRDTAVTAMQAATTGHLVLSTIHAKDTIGTVFRLLDLGVEPYLVASTLNLVLAQRLVRRLCSHCKTPKRPTPEQILQLGKSVEGLKQVFAPAGCKQCFGTGYHGRLGVFELLSASDEIRDVILNEPNIAAIKKAIEMTVFQSLRDAAMDLVMKGETSMDEVARVIGFD